MAEPKVASISNPCGSGTGKTKIMLVDDHPLLRQAVRIVLEKQDDFEVIAEAGEGNEAVKLARELVPDVIIMDLSMPGVNGLEATKQIKASCPGIAILILTVHTDSEHILSILEAGADGYLTKTVYGDEVTNAVRTLVCGEKVFSPVISEQILKYALQHIARPVVLEAGNKVTQREAEILKLVARGISNKEIADRLGVSLRTVKGHLADIFLKLNVASRTEAVIVGLRKGIFTPDDLA